MQQRQRHHGDGERTPRACAATRDNLSRFLDNDLGGREAARVADHLTGCAACRFEYEALKGVQAATRGLADAPLGDGRADAARERVFARLERAAETGAAWNTSRAGRAAVWAPAAAMLAAAAVIWAFVLNPAKEPAGAAPATVPLPSASEIATLSLLHDAHAAPLGADEPVARRDVTATARAALLDGADASVAGSL